MRRLAATMAAAAALALPAAPAIPADAPVPNEIPVGLLVDLSTGQTLFAREENRRFVPASVTKVMTAYTAFKLIEEGTLNEDATFLYSEALEEQWYAEGSNMFLRAGERPTIAQLLLGVTTVSGNDASAAIAVAAGGSLDDWLALMNANARELGMHDTHFGSPNGFPDGGETYTTASDLVLLGRAITQHYPDLYNRYFGHRSLRWRDIAQANHDPVTGRIEGADGMKTGYTNEAGFTFLGSAERDGRRLVMVLAGAPTDDLRDETARMLLQWGFEHFTPETLISGDTIVGAAQVQDGAQPHVNLRLRQDFGAAIPADVERDDWDIAIVYRGPLEAPINAGQVVARLRLTLAGETVLETPLEAASDVAQANSLQRITNAFRNWLG